MSENPYESSKVPAGKRRHRWLLYGLGAVLFLMVLWIGVAWIMGESYRARMRQQAEEARLQEMEGDIEYDNEATWRD